MALVKYTFLVVGLALTFAPLTAGIELVLMHKGWQGMDAVAYIGSFIAGVCLLWFCLLLRKRTSKRPS